MPKVLINGCVWKEFNLVVYVDSKFGSDINDGLTENSPVKTFKRANSIRNENLDIKNTAVVFMRDITIMYNECEFEYITSTCFSIVYLDAIVKANGTYALADKNITFIACDVRSAKHTSYFGGGYQNNEITSITTTFIACSVYARCDQFNIADNYVSWIIFHNCVLNIEVAKSSFYSQVECKCCCYTSINNADVLNKFTQLGVVSAKSEKMSNLEYGVLSSIYFQLFNLLLPKIIKSSYLDKIEIQIKNSDCFVKNLELIRIASPLNITLDVTPEYGQFPCFLKDTMLDPETDYSYQIVADCALNLDYFCYDNLFGTYFQNISAMKDRYQCLGEFKCYTQGFYHDDQSYLHYMLTGEGDINFGNTLPFIIIEKNCPFLVGGIIIYRSNVPERSISGFNILVSDDAVNWKLVFTEADGSTRVKDNPFIDCVFDTNYRTRYVGIQVTSKLDKNYAYVRNFKLYSFCNK